MDDRTNIRLVHSQTICARGDQGSVTGIEEPLLHPGPLLPGQPGVIEGHRQIGRSASHCPGSRLRAVAGAAEDEKGPFRLAGHLHKSMTA